MMYMEEVKRIPYGVSNFVDVIEQNQYYVDKTMYLPLLEDQPSNLFLIRPRRFGKSIFLSMMSAYYDIARKNDFEHLFGNLWIGKVPGNRGSGMPDFSGLIKEYGVRGFPCLSVTL